MERREIGSLWDRKTRNDINHDFEVLFSSISNLVGTITDEIKGEILEEILNHSKLNWKDPVNSFEELPENAEEGDVHFVRDSGKVYRWDGVEWVEIQELDMSALEDLEQRLQDAINALEASLTDEIDTLRDEVSSISSVEVSDIEPTNADIWFEVR